MAAGEHGGGRRLPQIDAEGLGAPLWDDAQILGELLVEIVRLRGKERHERVVRGKRDRRLHRRAQGRRAQPGVTLVSTGHRVHGVEDRRVDDGHRAARAAGSQLLAEHTAARHARGVIHAAGVDGHLVPVTHAIQHAGAASRPAPPEIAHVGPRAEARPERVFESAGEPLGGGANGQTKREHAEQERPASLHHEALLRVASSDGERRQQPTCQAHSMARDSDLGRSRPWSSYAAGAERTAERQRLSEARHWAPRGGRDALEAQRGGERSLSTVP